MNSKELNEILNKTRRTPDISLTPKKVEELIKDLEEKEKQDRILRIIKEKNVDIKHLKHFIKCYRKKVRLKTYNDYHNKEELTQEEYDLFEEWLKNEGEI